MKSHSFLNLLFLCILSCTAVPSSAPKSLSLDEVLRQSAEKIEERLATGTRVALINVRSPSDQFSEYVLTYLESILVNNRKLVVVDRSNLDRIRQELGFQLSGDVSDESAGAIGKMLGAGAIITGTLINIGDLYRLTLKAINVETATIAASYPADIANDNRVRALLASRNTATTTAGRQTPAPAQSTASQAPAYKIGDIGPAGGLIFYDKGNSTGGWRYLEAAPAETEWVTRGSTTSTGIWNNGITRKVGDGKENTKIFMNAFQQRGGGINTAAWLCDDLVVNGFDDWFLPSLDEVLYIYNNLFLKGIGEFKNTNYWSSTWDYRGQVYINFSNGYDNGTISYESYRYQVRAIRRF